MTTMEKLQGQLQNKCNDCGRLLFLAKQAYIAQLHRGTTLAESLLEEIHRHEPSWCPPPAVKREPWPTKAAVGSR